MAEPEGAPSGAAENPPALIGGKYKSVDEVVSALESLQRTLGQQSQELGVLRKRQVPEWGENDGLEAVLAKVGAKPDEIGKVFAEKKALPDDVASKLKELGLPRKAVEEVLSAQQSVAEAKRARDALALKIAHVKAGGPDKWQVIASWAESSLTPEEQKAINAKLGRDDTMEQGLTELIDLYGKKNAAPTGGILGGQGQSPPPGGQPFSSTREMNIVRRELRARGIDPDKDTTFQARLARTPGWIVRGGAGPR